MKVIDISGPIYNGMWNYSDQYPEFKLATVGFPYGGEVFPVDVFEGFHSQVGTYIESPGIFIEKSKKLNDIPLQKFYKVDTFILQIPYEALSVNDNRPFITVEDIKKAELEKITEDSVILISCGYGKNWDRRDFLEKSWFFKKEALYYLIEKKPFILGGDSPVWENEKNPEGAFEKFYKSGILLLAPCINLEQIKSFKVKSIILPLKVSEASICPVRAVVLEDYKQEEKS
jgi:kynurenine formamidase